MPGTPRVPAVVGVDIGGTFTDFVVLPSERDGALRVHKVLSTPDDPARAVLEGMRELGIGQGVAVVHGSTIATNAVLERKGARTALVTTAGFEDVLEIGRQDRPSLYDLDASRPEPLSPRELRFGARERIDSQGAAIEPLSDAGARDVARRVLDAGVESVAVCLLFSFLNPDHERRIRDALIEAGAGPYVYISSEVLPEYREYERTSTTVVNAYIAPVVHRYLARLRNELGSGLRIMQSSGGSVTAEGAMARPIETISGGPAGGVVGAFHLARMAGHPQMICLDMGGTSTDVCLCPNRVPETAAWELGGLPIRTPAIDVYSVGAGGGSIARIDAGGALLVGPESAGADPGPACYGKGSSPTVTDANLVLGRLNAGYFQGRSHRDAGSGGLTLDLRRAEEALAPIAKLMGTSTMEAAEGVVRVANANMARAIRVISVERGHDPRDFTLVAFGGAGPLHACDLAEALSIPRVLVPLFPGVLSAQGMTFADISREYSTTVMLRGDSLDLAAADEALAGLLERGRRDLDEMGTPGDAAVAHRAMDLRYAGQSHELTVPYDGETLEQVTAGFHEAHRTRFGYADDGRPVEIVNVRLKLVSPTDRPEPPRNAETRPDAGAAFLATLPVVYQGVRHDAKLYARDRLQAGNVVPGPAVVVQYDSTVAVPPGWAATVDPYLNLVMAR